MSRATLSYYDDGGRVRLFRAPGSAFTIGSDAACDLTIPGLSPSACRVYLAEAGYWAEDLGGGVEVDGRPGSGYLADGGTLTLGGWLSLRFAVSADEEAAPPQQAPAPVHGSPSRRPGARRHRPGTAVLLGLLGGGGQAYNGQPFKGAFILVTTPLVIPWVWGLLDARAVARRIAASGGRTGRGGPVWFLLHAWLAVNLVLLTAIVLTLVGVLS